MERAMHDLDSIVYVDEGGIEEVGKSSATAAVSQSRVYHFLYKTSLSFDVRSCERTIRHTMYAPDSYRLALPHMRDTGLEHKTWYRTLRITLSTEDALWRTFWESPTFALLFVTPHDRTLTGFLMIILCQ